MALRAHCHLHFQRSDSQLPLTASSPPPSLILYASLAWPPPSSLPGSVHFPTLFPSLRYWATLQLFVGGQNNYTETLIETRKSPSPMSWMASDLCLYSPSVCPSVTKKRICHHSMQNLVTKAVFHSSPLAYGKPDVAKHFLLEYLHIPWEGRLAGLGETAFMAKLNIARLSPGTEQIGEPQVCMDLNSNAGSGKFPPSSWVHTLKLAEPAFSPAATRWARSAAWWDPGVFHSAISSLNTYLSLVKSGCYVFRQLCLGSRDRVKMGSQMSLSLPLSISSEPTVG